VATPGAKLPVQVGDRLGQPGVVGGQRRPPSRRIPQAVQQRHALGRPEDHVEGGYRVAAVRPSEQLAGLGVAALEDPLERLGAGLAVLAEAGGAGAVPPAWALAVAGQVLLVVLGDLTGVVVLPPDRQLGHVRDHPAPASRPVLRERIHPRVHCSSEN
jgi:hypothetical protein